MSAPRRILGIDPGSIRTGYGLVIRDGGRLIAPRWGVLRPRGDGAGARLASLHAQLAEIVAALRPTEAALEDVFHHRNARSAFVLGQARGVALAALAEAGLEAAAYAPAMVKRVVAGHGAADKPQVGRAVRAILGLEELPGPATDAADALAVAVCHVLAGRARQMVSARS